MSVEKNRVLSEESKKQLGDLLSEIAKRDGIPLDAMDIEISLDPERMTEQQREEYHVKADSEPVAIQKCWFDPSCNCWRC